MSFSNLDMAWGVVTTGQAGQYGAGTTTAPDTTLNPVYKISRTISIPAAAVVGDGGSQATAFSSIAEGTPDNQVGSTGVFGGALNQGTARGATDNPDACGGCFWGAVRTAGAVGAGIGLYACGEASTSTARAANGAQLLVANNTGAPVPAATAGQSRMTGISVYSRGNATTAGVGVEIVGPYAGGTCQFDVGLRIMAGAAKTALVIEPGAGPVKLGLNYPAQGGRGASTGGIGTTAVSHDDVVRALKDMGVFPL